MTERKINLFEDIMKNPGYENKNHHDRDFVSLEKQYKMSRADIHTIEDLYKLGFEWDDTYVIPEYQRELVWTQKQKVDLIGSILVGNPIGEFLFKKVFGTLPNGHRDNCTVEWHVIDGQQRVNAIREFIDNKFTYNGKYFKELKYWDARAFINDYNVSALTVKEITLEIEIDIYLKRNIGGTAHTKEELEKARKFLIKDVKCK